MYVLLYLPPEPTPPRGHRGLKSSGPCRSSPWCPCRRPPSSSIAVRELDHAAFIDRTRTILVDPAVRGREAGMNAPGVRRRARSEEQTSELQSLMSISYAGGGAQKKQ